MRYLKDYNTFLLEKKNIELPWSDFFNRQFRRVVGNNKEAKVEKLQKFLSKDIFDSANKSIILSDEDKKIYSQSNTISKFAILMKYEYNNQMSDRYSGDLGNIEDFLSDANTTLAMLDVRDFEHLIEKANDYHDSLFADDIDTSENRIDETDKTDKFITYPSNWYWINLNTDFSEDEKNHMGHCGRDTGKILFSLRDENKQSHITASYSPAEKAVFQIKGRNNSKPKQIYHKYIVDMILNEKHPIDFMKTGWYKPELDFSLTDLPEAEMKEIYQKKPSLEMTDKMFEKYHKEKDMLSILSMCVNGFTYNDYNINRADNEEDISELFSFLDKQKINPDKNKDVIKRFLESTILLTYKVAEYDDSILSVLKDLDIKLDSGVWDVFDYPDIKKIQKYFKVEINNISLSHYIKFGNKEAFEYAISTKDFFMDNDILVVLCGKNISVSDAEYYLSEITTDSYIISLYEMGRYLRDSDNKMVTINLENKIKLFFNTFKIESDRGGDTYGGSMLGNDICSMCGVSLIDDVKKMVISKLFYTKYQYINYDNIYDIIYEFDNTGIKNEYVNMILEIILEYFDYTQILELIFKNRMEHKYIFKIIANVNSSEKYENLSVIFNNCIYEKYCLEFLDRYFDNFCPDTDKSKIDISSEQKIALKEYVKDLPEHDRTYTYSTACEYIENL